MPKPELAQRRHQEIAAVAKRAPALLEERERLRLEAGERRALRHRRRRDVEILRELLEVADVPLRRDDPAEPPPGHVEVLGEARHDEEIVGVRDPRRDSTDSRLAVVGQAEVDLVDDEPPAEPRDGSGDRAHLVGRDLRAGRIRRRRDQHAARARRPARARSGRRRAGSASRARPARRPARLRTRGRNAGCTGSRDRTAGSASSRSTSSAITSSSAADEPAVTITRSGAIATPRCSA